MGIYEELKARGLIAQVTDEERIRDLVNNGKATFYIGFDPTADSLHVGHFMALCLMKRLQEAGNKPIALIGGGTAMIGDPSGRTDMRQMMTPETIQHNCDCFKKQMSRFIDFSDGKALMVNNADWLMDLNYIEVLREVGAHFSVNRMLTAECYKQRMEKGLSFLEFNYMIMQAYDFYELFQKYGCNLEFGGDALGVSERARKLAPEYGIDYRTPIFAIHKNGHYGSIVGKGFDTMKEYHVLLKEAKNKGADFIKIMTTGLLDFNNHGQITGTPLDRKEVCEMVHIAHEEGMAVMSHTNGIYGVQAAVEAGVDSVEHGNYIDPETIRELADSDSVWVPTLVTIRNLRGCGRYKESVLDPIIELAAKNLRLAYKYRAKVALGSDAGAYMVLHGKGLMDEYQAFMDILGESGDVRAWLADGEKRIQDTFRRPES